MTYVRLEKCSILDAVRSDSGTWRLHATLRPLLKLNHLECLSFMESTKILDGDIASLLEMPSLKFARYGNRKHYNIRYREGHIKRWPGQTWPYSLLD